MDEEEIRRGFRTGLLMAAEEGCCVEVLDDDCGSIGEVKDSNVHAERERFARSSTASMSELSTR